MSTFAKFILATTAFAPILLAYAAVSALNGDCCYAVGFLVGCIVLVLLCAGLLRFARTRLEPMVYRTVTVETTDNEIFSILLVYLLPLITRDLSTFNWHVWLLVGIVFCLIVATSYGYHFNPLLAIFRYHFYKVTEERGIPHVLITRRRIYRTGEKLEVGRLAEYVLIEKLSPDQGTARRRELAMKTSPDTGPT